MEASKGEILQRRHELLDSIPLAFVITDVHSKIIYANLQTEYLFGYKGSEIKGAMIRTFFLEDDLTYFLPNIIYLTCHKEGFKGEALLRQKDGKRIFVYLLTTSFKEQGEVFLTFSFQEIQRLKRLERERLEAERWAGLGRMVEEIAHQVRNPVVSIGGYAKRLLKDFPSSQKSQSYLDLILRETGRLETLIRRVEEYVQIPRPVFQKENIQEVVETALQPFSKEAAGNGISFAVETKGLQDGGTLFIDKGLVIKAISHVLQNSIEAINTAVGRKQRESVRIALFDDGDRVRISVSDKGQGIPRKNLGLVFEPFFSTRPARVGLGLTFVKRVTDEHGGSFLVESRLNRGTTITLYFPKDRRRKVRRELIPGATGSGD